MAGVTVKIIDGDGVVRDFVEIGNAMSGSLLLWSELDTRYCGGFSLSNVKCWGLLTHAEMSDRDCLVCAFTCDGCWVARENLEALAVAMESFVDEHLPNAVPTLRRIAKALRDIASDSTCRGACVHWTGVVRDPWTITEEYTGRRIVLGRSIEEPVTRRFVFGRDAANADGREPWELFEEFSPAKCAERRERRP